MPPNSVVISNSIVNRSTLPLCRAQAIVGVDYNCDLKVAKEAVLKAAVEHPLSVQNEERQAAAYITALGDNAIEITLWAGQTKQTAGRCNAI